MIDEQAVIDRSAVLARAAQGGDSDAFGDLYSSHRDAVRGLLRRLLRDDGDADEAMQHVFLTALRSIKRFDPNRGSFGAWLHTIATRQAFNVMRTRRQDLARGRAGTQPADMRTTAGGEVDLLGDAGFRALLAALPKDQRAVVFLRYQHDMTVSEIAQVLGRSPAAVAQLHRRALTTLRGRVAPPGTAALLRPAA